MELHGCKRHKEHFREERGNNLIGKEQCSSTESSINFPLLELPVHIICDILSRLSLKNICRCRCVCKRFLKLLKDPYFANVHLARAPISATNLILRQSVRGVGHLSFFPFDLCEASLPACSTDDKSIHRGVRQGRRASTSSFSGNSGDRDIQFNFHQGHHTSRKLHAEFGLRAIHNFVLIGSCNGLLCLCFGTSPKPTFSICNPLLGELIKLPSPNVVPPLYTYACHSGFGYCRRTKQYKVVSFMYQTSGGSVKIVGEIHTFGSNSWRTIEGAPLPKTESFDPYLNGALHWITTSSQLSELISSFDLEKEKFKFVPRPANFNVQYMDKVSWMNVGILRDCLCVCSIYEDALFEVWVMREYGVKESWRKEFCIDMKFYCMQVQDLHRPVRFWNGDLWFVSSTHSLVSFCPKTRTFRELRAVGLLKNDVAAHDLSFVSLKDVAGARGPEVKNLKRVGKKWFLLQI